MKPASLQPDAAAAMLAVVQPAPLIGIDVGVGTVTCAFSLWLVACYLLYVACSFIAACWHRWRPSILQGREAAVSNERDLGKRLPVQLALASDQHECWHCEVQATEWTELWRWPAQLTLAG